MDDYDVISAGRDIRRIFKPRADVPEDHPWVWTITGAVVMPHLPSHGFCASLGKVGGQKSEAARMIKLSRSKRRQIARRAARTRGAGRG